MKRVTQQGMAVINALVVVMAVSIATMGIVQRQSGLATQLASERDYMQANWLLRGALDWAVLVLRLDSQRSAVTHRGGLWAQALSGRKIETPDKTRAAYFSGYIQDEQGKFNLALLLRDGRIQARYVQALEQLLGSVQQEPSLALELAQRLERAQAGQAPWPSHLQDFFPNAAQQAKQLEPYLSYLPQAKSLNVNTASAQVLAAVQPSVSLVEWRGLLEQRDRGQWFRDQADVQARLQRQEALEGQTLSVRSEWFLLSGELRLDHSRVATQALINRAADRSRIVWIR